MQDNKIYRAGTYARLSREDKNDGQSTSVENQCKRTRMFVESKGWALAGEYVDDGYSGTDFGRPGFTKLLEDIESGKIDCVVLIDHSRLGRDVSLCSYYRETYFPNNNIRYISILDGYDSIDMFSAASDMAGAADWVNQMHVRQTSKKVRNVKEMNARIGNFMNSRAPYGYLKSSEDKHKLVIDEQAAPNVRRIFELMASGETIRNIAAILNRDGITPPIRYWYEKEDKPMPPHVQKQSPTWSYNTVRTLLDNPVYAGDMASGKRRNATHKKGCKRLVIPKDEWIVVRDTHEPIVPRKLYDEVKRIMAEHAIPKYFKQHRVYLFSGIARCARCGGALAAGMKGGGNSKQAVYRCSRYVAHTAAGCANSRYFSEKMITEAVLNDLKLFAARAKENKRELIESIMAQSAKQRGLDRSSLDAKLAAEREKLESCNFKILRAFSQHEDGTLDAATYSMLIADLQAQANDARETVQKLSETKAENAAEKSEIEEWTDKVTAFLELDELTFDLVRSVVERIYLDHSYCEDGREIIRLDIEYKLVGKVSELEWQGRKVKATDTANETRDNAASQADSMLQAAALRVAQALPTTAAPQMLKARESVSNATRKAAASEELKAATNTPPQAP